jgi:hypothetical protein
MNLRLFLRLQTDTYLTTLRDTIATELASNVEYISISMGGKSSSQKKVVSTIKLATALAQVLIERDLQGSDYVAKERMTRVRFA